MPSCRVSNNTPQPLNISLKQVTALHFENGVQSGQTIKLKSGKVWFTLEAKIDDGTKQSRYSVLKSAATIALLSIAVGAVAATAGAAMLPASVAAGGTAASAYLAKGMAVGKGALIKNSGTIAKISSVALPKAIEKMSSELGGLSALQREVMSIVASPTLSSDVRHKATGLLRQLYDAYSTDKSAKTASGTGSGAGSEVGVEGGGDKSLSKGKGSAGRGKGLAATAAAAASTDPTAPSLPGQAPPSTTASASTSAQDADIPPFTHPDLSHVDSATIAEARSLETQMDEAHLDDRVENTPVSTDEVLRVHGIYMNQRRHFEIRVDGSGRLVLWDADEGKVWGT